MSILAKLVPNYTPPAKALPTTSIASPQSQGRTKKSVRELLSRGEVGWSPDLSRIMALPRRGKPDFAAVTQYLEGKLRRDGGTQTLRPIQAWALWEAPVVGGLLAPIGVGEGKSLLDCLMAMVMPNCQRAVLFVPAHLRIPFLERDWPLYGQHWKMPNLAGGSTFIPGRPVLHVISYSELSSPRSSALLDRIKPDLIIADEVHNLRYKDTARSRRFLRYFQDATTDTMFAGWSGTITASSIRDYAHLAALALGAGTPLPIHVPTVEEWASALDADATYEPGKLLHFCNAGESVRSGYRRRFVETVGVVASDENELGTALTFKARVPPPPPSKVALAVAELRADWKRPDGEELVDQMSVNRCAVELACGFYYRWRFPRGEPEELILRWFSRRQEWNKELRRKLQTARTHLDSPKLCVMAALRYYRGGCPGCERGPLEEHKSGCVEAGAHPLWAAETWLAWDEVRNQVYHETEAVWVSDYLLHDIADWMKEPGIVWTAHTEVGERLAALTKLPYYAGGDDATRAIIHEDGSRAIAASMKAHGEGKNLQTAFSRNLMITPPASAQLTEQVIGRTHRPGQPKDEVEFYFYQHTPELRDALEKARNKAAYVQESVGNKQRLVYGNWTL